MYKLLKLFVTIAVNKYRIFDRFKTINDQLYTVSSLADNC